MGPLKEESAGKERGMEGKGESKGYEEGKMGRWEDGKMGRRLRGNESS